MADKENRVGNYYLAGTLGRGGFGEVYRAQDARDGRFYALKTVASQGMDEEQRKDLMEEIDLLKMLDHQNVINYYETFEEDERLYIVLELADQGSMVDMLEQKQFENGIPESLVQVYLYQILLGLSYLHSEGVIHRDIKGANLLLTSAGVVKMADFGVATSGGVGRQDEVVGTPYWMAPEIIEMKQQTPKCDIWSLGCTCIELVTAKPPYWDLEPLPAMWRIVQDDHPEIPPTCTANCEDFLLQCFQKEPDLRPSAKQLLRHAWVKVTEELQPNKVMGKMDDIDGGYTTAAERAIQLRNEKEEFKPEEDEISWNSQESGSYYSGEGSDRGRSVSGSWSGSGRGSRGYSGSGSYPYSGSLEQYVDKEEDEQGLEDVEIDISSFNQQLPEVKPAGSGEEDGDMSSDTDPFEDIDDADDGVADQSAKADNEVKQLLRGLEASWQPEKIDKTVQRLSMIFKNDAEQISSAMNYHGVIPIMEMLDHEQNLKNTEYAITKKVLELINQIITHDNGQAFLESLCVVGLIPSVANLLNVEDYDIRIAATDLIKRFCRTDESNNFVRKMFVASDGIRILVSMLQRDYEQNKEIMVSVLDCIYDIFMNPPTLQERREGLRRAHHPKRDFCRLFTKGNLLRPLVVFLRNLIQDKDFDCDGDISKKVGWVMQTIASQNDPVVKKAFVAPNVLGGILRILTLLDSTRHVLLLHILKVMRYLTDAATIEQLIVQNAVSGVCPFLDDAEPDIQNQVIMCIYFMVKLERKCREEAASNGIIPKLMELTQINEGDNGIPTRSFVIAILCKMVELASYTTLYEMKKHNGIEFFLNLVQKTRKAYIQVDALQALANWLRQDTPRVELQIIQQHHVTKLITVFEKPNQGAEFLKILSSMHEMIKTSRRLADEFGKSEVFLKALEKWLVSTSKSTDDHSVLVLKNLLQFTSNLFDQLSDSPKVRFVQILYKIIERIADTYEKIQCKARAENIKSLFETEVDIGKLGLHE